MLDSNPEVRFIDPGRERPWVPFFEDGRMPRTLLLADDSITIQKVVAITFQNEDYTVVAVDNGEDALAKARELKPDIILADVVMPRRNGYELCQAVKADPGLRSIPVLLLAGTFEAFDEGKAVAAQSDGHIVKPFDSQVLIDRVNAMVTGQPMPAAAAAPAPRPAAPAPIPVVAPAAPPAFVMPRPPMPPGMAQGIPPARPPSMAPPPPPVAGGPLPPLSRPPLASPPAVAAPPRPPMPFTPGVPILQPSPVAPPSTASRPPFVGTPTPMLTPGGLPPVGSPPGAGLPRPAFTPPVSPLGAQPPPGITLGRPAKPATSPPQPRPMSLTPAPWAVSSAPAAPAAPRPGTPTPSPVPAPGRSPTVAWSSVLGGQAPAPAAPAPSPVGRKTTPTPMWGVPVAKPESFDIGKAPPAPAPPSPPSVVVEAGLSATSSDLSVDVAMEESSPNMDLNAIRASASARFDISEGDDNIRTSSLSDLAQGSFQSAPVGEIEIEGDGSPDDELELAPANDFVPGAAKSAEVPAAPAPLSRNKTTAKIPTPAAPDGGEATLRAALSQASREVIEKIAWEVVPQLAEVIIREHVERLARERSSK